MMHIDLAIRNRDLVGGRNQLRGELSDLLPASPEPSLSHRFHLRQAEREDLDWFFSQFDLSQRSMRRLDELGDRALHSVDRWLDDNTVRVEVNGNDTIGATLSKYVPLHSDLPENCGYVAVDWSSDRVLDNEQTLNDAGVGADDLLAVFRGDHVDYMLIPAASALRLLTPLLLGQDPGQDSDDTITGVLLYSDEDAELSRYVREQYLSLNRASGPHLKIFVTEAPDDQHKLKGYWRWKAQLTRAEYQRYSVLQWLCIKPYDRAECYELCRQLDIPFDHLPCLLLLGGDGGQILTFAVPDPPSKEYFRTLFTRLNEVIDDHVTGLERRLNAPSARAAIGAAYQRIVSDIERAGPKDRAVTSYTFNGYTVFVNRPRNSRIEGGPEALP